MTDDAQPETQPDTRCPDCGRPRPVDGESGDPGVCTNPACPAAEQPEVAANRPTGGDDIGA